MLTRSGSVSVRKKIKISQRGFLFLMFKCIIISNNVGLR